MEPGGGSPGGTADSSGGEDDFNKVDLAGRLPRDSFTHVLWSVFFQQLRWRIDHPGKQPGAASQNCMHELRPTIAHIRFQSKDRNLGVQGPENMNSSFAG